MCPVRLVFWSFCNVLAIPSYRLAQNNSFTSTGTSAKQHNRHCHSRHSYAILPAPRPLPPSRYEPPIPTRIGKRKKKSGPDVVHKLPAVTPHANCKLRLLKLERIKDYLLMEQYVCPSHLSARCAQYTLHAIRCHNTRRIFIIYAHALKWTQPMYVFACTMAYGSHRARTLLGHATFATSSRVSHSSFLAQHHAGSSSRTRNGSSPRRSGTKRSARKLMSCVVHPCKSAHLRRSSTTTTPSCRRRQGPSTHPPILSPDGFLVMRSSD